ncbi:type VII secretion-associated serine protease mycosin [Streptomyces sp. NPDC095613]|uniref:type VII secretion-associated serine protease mycosin n=1 Tax=Streptomyces sp. NPDC095613 TaxID=3155540 RepID=UPI00331FCB97
MKADEIWKISTGEGVTVAVIDSGVDATNPDLQGRVLKGKDFAPDSAGDEHTDYKGHGTGMAGLIAGTGRSDGGDGAYGLAPGSKILPIRTPDSGQDANRESEVRAFNESVPVAIRYATDKGAAIINISMASRKGSPALTSAVKYALDKGALVFAAAGNTGDAGNELEFPVGTPGVVGVGALDKEGQKTKESQYGPQVDISAPGEEMVHACGGTTGLCTSHGTSDATAIASASAALIWSKHPDWTNNQVLRVMLNTVSGPTDGVKRNDYVGYGAVRPLRALTTPGDPGPADEYPLPDLAEAGASASSSAAAGDNDAQASPSTAAVEADESGGAGLWIGLGAGAAVVLGAAVAVPVIRSRRG